MVSPPPAVPLDGESELMETELLPLVWPEPLLLDDGACGAVGAVEEATAPVAGEPKIRAPPNGYTDPFAVRTQ